MLWQTLTYLPHEEVLILEDDAWFEPSFRKRFRRAYADLPKDWQFVFVGAVAMEGTPLERITDRVGVMRYPCGTHGYLVKRSTLPILLQTNHEARMPIDLQLIANSFPSLKCYTFTPSLVKQRSSWSPVEGTGENWPTTIGIPDGDGESSGGDCFPDDVPGWFTQAECRLWSEACRDRNVLELGRYHGRSTVVAAQTAHSVVSIDNASEQPADAWLRRYGLRHKVWLRQGLFADLTPTSGGPFSACLIDGDHSRRSVKADIAAVVAHLAPQAVIGFHDYGDPDHPDVKPVVDAMAKRQGWRLVGRADYLALFATPDQTEKGPQPR
jgi:hypothetical protein